MATPNPNGFPNSYFISWIRRKLRDQPAFFAETIPTNATDGIVTAAGAKPYRTQRAPIIANTASVTAPFPANSGLTSWSPKYDTAGDPPLLIPVISDNGAGGGIAAGTYQVAITYMYGVNESGFSLLSSPLAIAATHTILVGALAGIPNGVTAIRYYLFPSTAAAAAGGFAGQLPVVNNAIGSVIINTPGDGTAPVDILTDTGEIIFPLVPPAGNLNITYQATRFSDTQILNALTDGLKAMYPAVWQLAQDTTLIPSSVFYEYTLPAVFADMRVILLQIEIRSPNTPIVPFKRYKKWRRTGPLTLSFADRFSPAGVIRLSYNAPYQALSDLEPIAMHLPCYYAMAILLKEQDAMRTRATEMVPQTGEGGSKSGDALMLSRDWKDLFDAELDRLSRPSPFRPDAEHQEDMSA